MILGLGPEPYAENNSTCGVPDKIRIRCRPHQLSPSFTPEHVDHISNAVHRFLNSIKTVPASGIWEREVMARLLAHLSAAGPGLQDTGSTVVATSSNANSSAGRIASGIGASGGGVVIEAAHFRSASRSIDST